MGPQVTTRNNDGERMLSVFRDNLWYIKDPRYTGAIFKVEFSLCLVQVSLWDFNLAVVSDSACLELTLSSTDSFWITHQPSHIRFLVSPVMFSSRNRDVSNSAFEICFEFVVEVALKLGTVFRAPSLQPQVDLDDSA